MRWKPRNNAKKKFKKFLPPEVNKDGTLSKKINVRIQCNMCKEWFKDKEVVMDHKFPVCPVDTTYYDMTLDIIAERMYPLSEDSWQPLCKKKCNKLKTNAENELRKLNKKGTDESKDKAKPSKKRKPNRSNRTK